MRTFLVKYADTGKLLVPAEDPRSALARAERHLAPRNVVPHEARVISEELADRFRRRGGIEEVVA